MTEHPSLKRFTEIVQDTASKYARKRQHEKLLLSILLRYDLLILVHIIFPFL